MTEPVITVAPDKAFLDPSKIVRSARISRQSPKIRILTDILWMSVDRSAEREEGKIFSSSSNMFPTAAQLYTAHP